MIRFKFLGLISIAVFIFFQTVVAQKQQQLILVKDGLTALTDIMVFDITSPPVASRNYAYCLISFYEAVVASDKKYKSYTASLNGLTAPPQVLVDQQYNFLLAGITAFYTTAHALVFSKDQFEHLWIPITLKLNKIKISPSVHARSIEFGNKVAAHIIEWAKNDGFGKTRTLPRYTPGKQAGNWQPTGPDYMEAVEPYWSSLRKMINVKNDTFLLPRPAPFKSAKFLTECKEVYDACNNITPANAALTNFWDCNPFATQTVGHMMYSVKKLSPAGHWVGIAGIVVQQKNESLVAALYTYSLVSIAIFDAILSTWEEKYRSNYIRPITAIQQLISPTWEPFLQTPPFPEYPSGHSVISYAAATILTKIYGDDLNYVDDVEKPFGLPARSFSSFYKAAAEAANSRLYGGIHFRESIENGKILGEHIAHRTIEKLLVGK